MDNACRRCGSAMETGFVVDEGYGKRHVATWHEGAPEKSFWSGISRGRGRRIQIETWRCRRCGLLESYAPA